jgi:hypothetical protein
VGIPQQWHSSPTPLEACQSNHALHPDQIAATAKAPRPAQPRRGTNEANIATDCIFVPAFIANKPTTTSRRLWLWNVRHLLTSTIKRLPPYRWTILKAPEGVSWPTTDNPLVRLNFHNINQYDFGGGWGVRNGDIFIPLSPQYLLFTCIGRRSWPRGTTLNKGLAILIRKMIVEHADRYVFSQDTSDIELIRPRTVCRETYSRELLAWKTWHKEQCQAESDLS